MPPLFCVSGQCSFLFGMDPSFEGSVRRDAGYYKGSASSRRHWASPEAESALAELLLEWVSWGTISFPMLQQAAKAAVADGAKHSVLQRMAALGGENERSGNMRRDLLRFCKTSMELPAPELISIPIIPAKGERKVTWIQHPVYLPHVMFHFVHKLYPSFFASLIEGVGPQLFWDTCPDNEPRLEHHPVKHMRDYRSRAIPLVLHGDGAQYTTHGDSLKSLQWSVLGSEGVGTRSWDHVFLITSLVSRCAAHEDVDGVDTWCIIYNYVVQSFNCLLFGIFPQKTPSSEPWRDGQICDVLAAGCDGDSVCDGEFIGFLYLIAADLDYTANDLGLEHYNAIQCCWACKARQQTGELNFRDVSAAAGWRGTVVGYDDALAASNHPLWSAIGVTRHTYLGDLLHTAHLGVYVRILGGALEELCARYPGGDKESRCRALWKDVQRVYATTGRRIIT